MNGETLPKSVKASIIKVTLIKKMAINVVWCITTLNHCTDVYYNKMSNQLYLENKGKDI